MLLKPRWEHVLVCVSQGRTGLGRDQNRCLITIMIKTYYQLIYFTAMEADLVIRKKKKENYLLIITKDLVTAGKPGDFSMSGQMKYASVVQGCLCFISKPGLKREDRWPTEEMQRTHRSPRYFNSRGVLRPRDKER